MKSKKFLSIVCALIMMFAISIAVVDTKNVSAAESARYYYGTTLLTTQSGSPTIESSLKDGAKVTFKASSSTASVGYKHTLYTQDLQISFNSASSNFEELWFKLTDADNDTKWVKVSLKKASDKIQYKLEDNNGNKTEYVDSGVSASKLAEGLTLSLKDKNFKLDNVDLNEGNIKTLSFYKNMANLSYGVSGVDSEGSDAVVSLTKINNQTLTTTNNKFEGANRAQTVIISKADGVDAPITSPISPADEGDYTFAAENTEYAFNYYCLDVLGTGWAVAVGNGAKVSGQKTVSVGAKDSVVEVAIYSTIDSTDALITLKIKAVKDTTKVELKDKAAGSTFADAIISMMEQNDATVASGHIVAPTTGNTYEFPHVDRDMFNAYFTAKDGDSFDNVKIQVGYKAPGDNGDYTYVSSYAVKLNETGIWYFVYKVTDVAGNETLSNTFSLRVFDETAPVISVSEKVEIIVDEKYTIPSATITDNASGVDSRYTKWTLYKADENGNKVGDAIANVKYGEEGYDESELQDGVLTPSEIGAKYVVVYEAQDKDGNVAEIKSTVITVVEGTPSYTANPFNDFVKTALIVTACLAGLGIIILIFVKPRERSLK